MMNKIKIFLALIMCFAFLVSLQKLAKAAIDLLYFRATTGNGYVQLDWETATELNNAGFFVQRSNQENQGYVRIHDELIPAQGDPLTGASYQYVDAGLTNGTQYWYRLESIDFGQNSEYSTPIFVLVGGTPTPTPTGGSVIQPTATFPVFPTFTPTIVVFPTSTSTALPTSPIIQQFVTPSPNPGVNPPPIGGQAYPGPENTGVGTVASQIEIPPVPLQGDSELLGTSGEIPPLTPFPEVVILFPTSNIEQPLPDVERLLDAKTLSWSKLVELWPLGVILIAWVGVAIWFYFSNRQFD